MYYHRRPPSLWPLSACFCLIFSDAVGVGVLFLYYAKRAFRWGPDMIGYVQLFLSEALSKIR